MILPHYASLKSSDVVLHVFFMHANDFSFTGKARFRRATLSYDNSY